jgi:hypothetical protein
MSKIPITSNENSSSDSSDRRSTKGGPRWPKNQPSEVFLNNTTVPVFPDISHMQMFLPTVQVGKTSKATTATTSANLIYPDEESSSSSFTTKLSSKQARTPVTVSIVDNFLNAMATDPSLIKLSATAKTHINALLQEIQAFHNNTLLRTREECLQQQGLSENYKPIVNTTSTETQTTSMTRTSSHYTQTVNTQSTDTALHLPAALWETLTTISDKIDNISQKQHTYATAAASNRPQTIPETPKSTLVIRPPNTKQIPKITSQLQTLKPPPHVKISKFKTQQHSIELRTTTEPAKEELKTFLIKNLPEGIPVADKIPATSKLIFFNVPEDLEEADLQHAIATRLGSSLPETPVLILKKTAAKRESSENWTVQLPRSLAVHLLSYNYILHGFRKIYFRRHIFVRRCTKCQMLDDHNATVCPNRLFCSLCSGNHHYTTCQANQHQLRCINCVQHNERNVNDKPLDTQHSTNSGTCPTFQRHLSKHIEASKAQYSYSN